MKLEEEIRQQRFKNDYQRLIINLLFTHGWLNGLMTGRLKEFDLSPQQFNILRILRGQHPQPSSVNLLKERMLDKMSNASRLVEKLRIKGLVEREICPEDRRGVHVLITQKGLELLKTLDHTESEWENRFHALNRQEVGTLNTLLDKLRG